jgi:hypothetical protein
MAPRFRFGLREGVILDWTSSRDRALQHPLLLAAFKLISVVKFGGKVDY